MIILDDSHSFIGESFMITDTGTILLISDATHGRYKSRNIFFFRMLLNLYSRYVLFILQSACAEILVPDFAVYVGPRSRFDGERYKRRILSQRYNSSP